MNGFDVKCLIRSVKDPDFVIEPTHKVPVILGRNVETKIKDPKCSRNQPVVVTVDLQNSKAVVKKIGKNASAINGTTLVDNEEKEVYNNDVIHVVLAEHIFNVEFQPVTKAKELNDKRVHSPESKSNRNSKKYVVSEEPSSGGSKMNPFFFKDCVVEKTGKWETDVTGTLFIFTPDGIESRSKIASYDLDGTLIGTKTGKVFAKDKTDWKIAFPPSCQKLMELYQNNYKIVIFTNQAGIGRGKIKVSDFKWKIENILRSFNVPIQVFIATKEDIYRKPLPGMWRYLVNSKNDGIPPDIEQCFFCGDAAGRLGGSEKKGKKDFSISDRLFALNLNLKFFTPEEHFLNHKTLPFELPKFNPSSSLSADIQLTIPVSALAQVPEQEMIIMVGPPASGKTHFVKRHLEPLGYVRVNRDTLHSRERCLAAASKHIGEKKSAVIDNTNPDKESRYSFLNIAKKYNVPVRLFFMNLQPDHVKHNNKFRQVTDTKHIPVTEAVINSYYSRFEEPALEEGYTEIIKVNFLPQFNNLDDQQLYNMYLLER